MRTSFSVLSFALLTMHPAAQGPPEIEWQRCMGGTAIDREGGVLELSNGDILMVMNPGSNGGNVPGPILGGGDAWLAYLSAAGETLTERLIGGPGGDMGLQLLLTADGNICMIGSTTASGGDVSGHHGSSDVWFVELDASLNIVGQRCYGGGGNDGARALAMPDGGFVLYGGSTSADGDVPNNLGGQDAWVLRIDSSGDVLWSKTYGGSSDDGFRMAVLGNSNDVLLVGATWSNDGDLDGNMGFADAWVVRIDASNGALLEQTRFGGSGYESAGGLVQLSNGDLLVVGVTDTSTGDFTGYHGGVGDSFLARFGPGLSLVWAKCYGGNGLDEFYTALSGPDGSVTCSGMTMSSNGDVNGNHGDADFWVASFDGNGALLWQRCYGGSGNDRCYDLHRLQDQGLIAIGSTNSSNGDVSGFHGGFSDAWVVRLSPETVGILEQAAFTTAAVSPNPAQHGTVVTIHNIQPGALRIDLYNALGAHVANVVDGAALPAEYRIPIAVHTLPAGLYTVRVQREGLVWSTKLLVEH